MKRKYAAIILALLLSLFVSSLKAQEALESALEKHVKVLTHPSLKGRGVGTKGEEAAAIYISKYFKQHNLEYLYLNGMQDFSLIAPNKDTLVSQNVVAVVEGSDPVLRNQYILVGAHYDHLGSYTMNINGRDSLCIYTGANANASGVAVMLELARMAQSQSLLFQRSLIFVAFGAEEVGMVGSWYFANRAFNPITDIKLMVNLDMMGLFTDANKPQAYTGNLNPELARILAQGTIFPGFPPLDIKQNDFFPSDHKPFMEKGLPVCLFTTGLGPEYRTLRDTDELLDYSKMSSFANAIFSFLQIASRAEILSSGAELTPEQKTGQSALHSYAEVEKQPTFQNGDLSSFERWMYKYIKYPQYEMNEGIQGDVNVSFVIETDGMLSNIKVERSVSEGLDAEAIRVISVSPKWKAGTINGEKVRVKCVIPVHFRLSPTKRR